MGVYKSSWKTRPIATERHLPYGVTCHSTEVNALPELSPCPHDNSCVGCRGTELATSRFFCVEFDDIVEVCWPTLIKSSVHHGGDLELNSCFTGNQWRRCTAGLMCAQWSSLRTSRAATFCTRCRGARVDAGSPKNNWIRIANQIATKI